MKTRLYWTQCCISEMKQFYKDERGVYTFITGMMGAILLGLVALAVDGSGILLDKARLSQGMEQAAIALVTENNYIGKRTYSQLTSIAVTDEEIKQLIDNNLIDNNDDPRERKLSAQRYKRDQALTQGIVSLYMRSYDPSLSASQKWVTIKNNFDIACNKQEVTLNNARNSVSVCRVNGEVDRKSWLPLTDNPLTFDKEEKLTTARYYAAKRDSVLIPLDLMLVSDFSGSMNSNIAGRNAKPTKLDTLKEVVKEVEGLILRGLDASEKLEVSPYNRMGFAAFAEGAAQHDGQDYCILPYEGKTALQQIEVLRQGFSEYEYQAVGGSRRPWKNFEILYADVIPAGSFRSSTCTNKTLWIEQAMRTETMCTLTASPSAVLAKAVSMHDVRNMEHVFKQYFQPAKTVDGISSFDGNVRDYALKFRYLKNYCLGGNEGRDTTQAWFTQSNLDISTEMNKLVAVGGTGASSGFLIGANILMGINPDPESAPNRVGTNTQRVLLVLSDGQDNSPGPDTIAQLVDAGMCEAVRKRVEDLQDPNYTKLPLRMGFVAFGYDPREAVNNFVRTRGFNGDIQPGRLTTTALQNEWRSAKEAVLQSQAWLKCVGTDNYYLANSKAELLDAFKQIIGKQDEVGRTTNPSSITDF